MIDLMIFFWKLILKAILKVKELEIEVSEDTEIGVDDGDLRKNPFEGNPGSGIFTGESAGTDAEDVLNEGNTISHSAALQSVETLLDYMGQRGFDYGDITAVRKRCVDIRQEMNKQQKQRRIKDFLKQ
ncbi:hypothetical protein AVEN_104275-1 [Araneus ventricosus]|uniref:Uncharacterized protein n=1 Tax=Araneus ventricosus TaxID=182803 RepID=A0A4Y2TUN0_ARAVE|nr:hypothetical protein AVEN_104275-1 [Araneus ventricosus]